MNGRGKSDRPVVPAKLSNNAALAAAEVVEGRGVTKGNTGQQNASRTQGRNHGVSFKAQKPKAASGVDGVTWAQYAENLEENLRELHDKLHQGAYRAKPTGGCSSRSQMAASGHLVSHVWKTRSSSARCRRC